jgi:hypothetical protein
MALCVGPSHGGGLFRGPVGPGGRGSIRPGKCNVAHFNLTGEFVAFLEQQKTHVQISGHNNLGVTNIENGISSFIIRAYKLNHNYLYVW